MTKRNKNKTVVPVFVDVEADGPSPVTHSMLQVGMVDPLGNAFKANFHPRIGMKYDLSALNAIGMTYEQTLTFPEAPESTRKMVSYLETTYVRQNIRPIFWSDNPAFDWQFVNGYISLYGYRNPFGFSARRIGDFFSGLNRDLSKSVQWKKWRETAHTHDALDDAKGNMEAWLRIKKEYNVA